MSNTPKKHSPLPPQYSPKCIGGVLATTLAAFIQNLAPYTFLALLITSPFYILKWVFLIKDIAGLHATGLSGYTDYTYSSTPQEAAMFVGLSFLFLVLGLLTSVAISHDFYRNVTKHRVSFGKLLRSILQIPPAGVVISIVIPFVVYFIQITASAIDWILIYLVGALFIILADMFFVIIPVVAIERIQPIAAFKRSFALTKGCLWRIMGVLCTIIAIGLAIIVLRILLMYLLSSIMLGWSSVKLALLFFDAITGSLLIAFIALSTSVAYMNLRDIKNKST